MRIRVSDVLDLMAAGLSPAEVVAELPDLEPDDITACLWFASALVSRQKLDSASPLPPPPEDRGGRRMRLFDAYIFIDWSAVNQAHPQQPVADAVWTGECIPALQYQEETYFRTRHAAFAHVLSFALEQIRQSRRVLIGFDFPYGYPNGFAQALGLQNGPSAWSNIWNHLTIHIQDLATNVNNRFVVASDLNAQITGAGAGPFWGCPPARATQTLHTHSPGFPFQTNNHTVLPKFQMTESRLPGTQETWKLFGNGSVGSQALVGIPYVRNLRNHVELQHCSKVWPFETQFTNAPSPATGPFILHAEIWPRVVNAQVNELLAANQQLIKDQAQVRAMCNWASELDVQGALGQYFASPQNLTDAQVQVCTEQEGWVFGAI
jgi:hypothetical protein